MKNTCTHASPVRGSWAKAMTSSSSCLPLTTFWRSTIWRRGPDLIAQQGRTLELELLGRGLHPAGQLRQHLLAVSLPGTRPAPR